MPTYIWKNIDSDITGGVFSKELNKDAAASGEVSIFIGANSTVTGFGYTKPSIPNSKIWDSGNYTVELFVTGITGSVTLASAGVARVNSAGVLVENIGLAPNQAITGSGQYTFTVIDPSIATGVCLDRLRSSLIFQNLDLLNSSNLKIKLNTADSEVISPVIEDKCRQNLLRKFLLIGVGR